MSADMYLPVWVNNLPIQFVVQPDGQLRDRVRRAVDMGVAKVIAVPTQCHVCIDVKRPYFKAVSGARNG